MPIYDVENRFSYYKSYSDNILVGPTRPTMGSYDWQRNVSGSVVSGSEEYKISILYSDFLKKYTTPFYRSGEVRYIRFFSKSQTIKDSITPSALELLLTGSSPSKPIFTTVAPFNTATPLTPLPFLKFIFAIDGLKIEADDSTIINNTEWAFSFPYEKKYFNVNSYDSMASEFFNKLFLIDKTAYGEDATTTFFFTSSVIPSFNTTYENVLIATSKSGSVETYIENFCDGVGYYNSSASPFPFSPGVLVGNVNNFNYKQSIVFGIRPSSIVSIPHTFAPSNTVYFTNVGFTIEGWKYGIYNGLPTNFSAVFRQNHYGQFRDMLEQRIYTKTYNNPLIGGPMDNNGGINFISGSALLGESNNYITASIYAADNVTEAYRVNPYGSGIFDKEYRASQPWYDNDPRVGT